MIHLVSTGRLRRLVGEKARATNDAAVLRLQVKVLREQRDRALQAVQAINRAHAYGTDVELDAAINAAMALHKVADNYDALQNVPTEHLES